MTATADAPVGAQQVAVITGGAAGIGAATAERLAEGGVAVVIADRDEGAAQRVAHTLSGGATHIAVDVTDDDAGQRLVDHCRRNHGRLDILVNSAGIYPREPTGSADLAVLDALWQVNVKGTIAIARAVGGELACQSRGGRVINVSSVEAFHPAMIGLSGYGATKGAIVSFTKHFALEMAAHDVTVNAVAPGPVRTQGMSRLADEDRMTEQEIQDMWERFAARVPLGRVAEPDDVAKVIAFYASSASGYVTGTTLVVDGGNLLS